MPIATFQTSEGVFPVDYRLAAGVAAAKAACRDLRIGTWLGDMGDKFHQWNDGLPSHGRRHGDHTAWSEDGPPGVVKAFDWTPVSDMARFKPWLLDQLRIGRYAAVCKFVNIDGGQWSGTGAYQKTSTDRHLHWSYLPGAVDSTINPLADYQREILEDTMDPVRIDWTGPGPEGGANMGREVGEMFQGLVSGAVEAGKVRAIADRIETGVNKLVERPAAQFPPEALDQLAAAIATDLKSDAEFIRAIAIGVADEDHRRSAG